MLRADLRGPRQERMMQMSGNNLKIRYKDCLHWILWIAVFQGGVADYLGFGHLSYLCDALLLFLFFARLFQNRLRVPNVRTRGELLAALGFFGVVLLGWLFRPASLPRALWGLRNYGRFFLFYCFALSVWKTEDVEKTEELFVKLLPFHMATVAFQFLAEGLKQDRLNGIFGRSVGGNGAMTLYLAIVLCVLLCRFEYGRIGLTKLLLWLFLLLVNAALSELKFFFLLAALLTLWYYVLSARKDRGTLVVLCFGVALIAGVQLLYVCFPEFTGYLSPGNLLKLVDEQKTYATQTDVGRTAVFSRLTPLMTKWAGEDAPLLGLGLGNGDYSDALPSLSSAFYNAYSSTHYTWLSLGYLFVETGYLGILAYAAFFVALEVQALKAYRERRSYRNLLGALFPLLCMALLIYNSSMRANYAYMAFTTLAWRSVAEKDERRNAAGRIKA